MDSLLILQKTSSYLCSPPNSCCYLFLPLIQYFSASLLSSTPMPANSSQLTKRGEKRGKEWLSVNFKPENFIPGLIIGFVFGLLFDLAKPITDYAIGGCSSLAKHRKQPTLALRSPNEELKMVLVVRQDLKMGSGKIASQCAHAATGLYSELIQSQRALVRQWEHCGQAKIVVTCKNQQEMNKLKEMAENIGLPTYVVADAGRTQVSSGSKTVLAIGPGFKSAVDSVTGKQHLL